MKLIKRDTDYALRAVSYIGKRGKLTTVGELVKKLHIPRPFLRKILQILNRHKILVSHKGARGGFIPAKPLNKIFLLDLIRIFQGEFKINECMFKKSLCPNIRICPLRKKIDKIENYAFSQFKNVTLADLVNGD